METNSFSNTSNTWKQTVVLIRKKGGNKYFVLYLKNVETTSPSNTSKRGNKKQTYLLLVCNQCPFIFIGRTVILLHDSYIVISQTASTFCTLATRKPNSISNRCRQLVRVCIVYFKSQVLVLYRR